MENSASIDKISDLPDEVLCHILSFLPIKQAFSTSFLSKRWAPLFKLLTSLHFDDESVGDEENFLRFRQLVDTVTLSTQIIKTFHLKCRSKHWRDDRYNVDRWIETAKQHPVENFQLISRFNCISLPPNIFRFSTLVVLKLMSVKVVGDISADLPSLQTLQLNDVCFENKECFNKLLFGCPILRTLRTSIYYIKKEEDEGVRLSTEWFQSLSNLNTADIDIDAFDVPFRVISNVKILMLTVKNRLPEINSYYGGFPVFQNLTDLNLCFYKFNHWNDVIEVLQYCPKLQILSIFKLAVKKHLSINWKYPSSVPECIASHLISCTINYEGWKGELEFSKYILQNAQLLEMMKVNIGHSSYSRLNRDPSEELTSCPIISPKCILVVD
ncbi:F-box/FBD/LRR-repeat protein At4g26340-like [Trifolium pratense]|uniref:F-box/FBD/LRR-repeat protein At4g26340-like n=1 Tax=Trifolium pratense TaxID=57577 RepID=UPI001E69530D|nr:F-box/FBD/LRR-repeat protein At4g26340-like [Trifolium pratense]